MDYYVRGPLKFRVYEVGPDDGDVVVALHGFPQNAETWRGFANEMAQLGYRVIVPDQRGYSPQARPRRRRSYVITELVSDLRALVESLPAERVHLVGHDFGGLVAWSFADRFNEKVATLTSISTPHPRAFMSTLLKGGQLRSSWYMIFFNIPLLPEKILLANQGRMLKNFLVKTGLPVTLAENYVGKFLKDPSLLTAALNWYRALALDTTLGFKTKSIKAPTLHVVGTNDTFVSPAATEVTKKWVEGEYRFESVQGGSHWIPEERPVELAHLVRDFIEQAHVRRFDV